MLREDVVAAVEAGQFHVWAVGSIDDGIELLTGAKAGKRDAKGQFPADSVHGRVEARLKQIAELLDRAGKPPADNKNDVKPDSNAGEEEPGDAQGRPRGLPRG